MNGILDDFLVGLILLSAFGYASYFLGPKSWRAPVLKLTATLIGYLPSILRARGVVQRLTTQASAPSKAAACGGCDNCGSTQTSPAAAQGSAAVNVSLGEIRVPLAQIGKRR